MARSYRHMEEYKEEILQMRQEGKTRREICERFGFTMEQMKNFISRYNTRQRKLAAGIAVRRRGRPPKGHVVNEGEKLAELRYILDRKDARIKRLEMENELLRDFLSLTERK